MNRPDLWVVRHGQTEWSRDGRHTGRTDLPLTAVGEQAATRLAERLGTEDFDLVLASPLQRARETARLAGFPEAAPEPAAMEWDYGGAEGKTTPQMQESMPDWSVWTHGAPGGETPEQVGDRCDLVVARVRSEATTRALLFAHGHVLRILAARWLDLAPQAGAHLKLDTSTVSVLSWERDTPALERWNA